jgi:hypothetical protein
MAAQATTILGYHFGSSSGSTKKDDTIANAMTNPAVGVAGNVTVQS